MASELTAVLEAMRVPGMDPVLVLGCFERRVTIASQQVRALNLVEALRRTDKLDRGTRWPSREPA